MKRGFLAAGVSCALACTASADVVINTYPDWDGTVTNGWVAVAQSFVAPGDNVLDHWMFALDPPDGQNSVAFNIYAWSDFSGPVGSSLYSSVEAWPAGGGDVLVDNIALSLAPGNRYAAVVHLQGYLGLSVHFQLNQFSYTDGDASWLDGGGNWSYLNSGWNTKFRAGFVPEPSTPLILTLGAAGLLFRRRRLRSWVLKTKLEPASSSSAGPERGPSGLPGTDCHCIGERATR